MRTEKIKLYADRDDVTLSAYIIDDSVEMLDGGKRPAVVVCPGGAYFWCGDREGEPVALKFASMGFHAFVLRYSLRDKCRFPQPMLDIAKAFECINENSDKWLVDVNQIAICGFSAGGHNCAMYSVYWNKPVIKDFINRPEVNLRPAACILGYPLTDYVYMNQMVSGIGEAFEFFDNSNKNFLGEDWMQQDLTYVSPARLVDSDVPPTFIWTTFSDGLVPCQHSILYAKALADKKIPMALHVFTSGDHGMSLCTKASAGAPEHMNADAAEWVQIMESWLVKFIKL